MKMYLIFTRLWGVIFGEDVADAAFALNLSDAQLMHVIHATSAKDAWGRFVKFNRTQDMANRLWLKVKLHRSSIRHRVIAVT